ncbi:MAG: RIP metalloprotease RseP [Bacteroidia bacterium]|nr:MAG: RIP metalloprotease RseP [Bacteroidia bacterium]
MDIAIRILQFFLSLSILVLLHELGHFIAARLCGVRVDKFYIFFNPWFSVFKRRIGQTEFGIGWLPLGGYCKIAGMVDESVDTEQLKGQVQADEFRAHPAWQRLLIISGGVLVNLLLAFLIYGALLYSNGRSYLATADVKYGIVADSLALEMGFRHGDRLVAVNGDSIHDFTELLTATVITPGARVTLRRGDSSHDITIDKSYLPALLAGRQLFSIRMPFIAKTVVSGSAAEQAGLLPGDSLVAINGAPASFFDEFRTAMLTHRRSEVQVTVARAGQDTTLSIAVPETGVAGVQVVAEMERFFTISTESYSLGGAMVAGVAHGWKKLADYVQSLKLLFEPKAQAHKSIGGFISIGKIFPTSWDWTVFWSLTAFLSLALAVMNFLPIPGLDGGHALFILYEMVTGRTPSDRFMTTAQFIGMGFLILVVLYANANDVIKLFN